ncbi:unnamed protein product [[Candida] boidinii]|uniref:Unnamed protein product n=1 Tax=Candida boidinii TaxID=5477 RepID=A0ACB5TFE3_CANBO|nr:unnamed protein product [[Candida] boidinii]GME97833.1 unnamed protein product [[Candida] boidinii]GMF53341.1 unnamed protein product [[Candida] boidinii]GMF66586.1 unnamed protein product [[Candida] boidinii]
MWLPWPRRHGLYANTDLARTETQVVREGHRGAEGQRGQAVEVEQLLKTSRFLQNLFANIIELLEKLAAIITFTEVLFIKALGSGGV